ncbi:hypothetical protein VTN96DRAFT_2757 [Rasamsonia emersonii]
MTRTASPVYLQLPHAPNNARPSKHTMLQYASLEDVPYREQWLRQLEERTAQQEHNTARGQQRRRQQHRNGNPYERFHSQQGTVQGQQHQSFTPQNTDQPPFVAGNAASLQYAFEQNGQHPQFAVPMRRRTDVWYCCNCSFGSGPYSAWTTECVELHCQHKRCDECLRRGREQEGF